MITFRHNRRTDNLLCRSSDSNKTKHRSRLPAASITLGTLSIAAFWMTGLSFALGATAAILGTIATSRHAVADDEAASLQAILGIVAGAAGIIVSAGVALLPMLAQR